MSVKPFISLNVLHCGFTQRPNFRFFPSAGGRDLPSQRIAPPEATPRNVQTSLSREGLFGKRSPTRGFWKRKHFSWSSFDVEVKESTTECSAVKSQVHLWQIQKERDGNTLVTKHLHRVTGAQGFCGSTAPPGGSSYVATVSWTSLRSQAGRPLICSSWNIQMHVAVLQWRRNTSAKENTSLSYQTHYHDKIIWKRVKNASEEHLNLQATSISKGWWGVREDLQWSQWRSKTPLASLRRWWQKVTF